MKRIVSLIVAVAIVFTGAWAVPAELSADEPTYGDDFDLYKYMANILAKSETEGGVPFLQDLLNNYRSNDYQSSSRIWVELMKSDDEFMGGLALWELYTIDVSEAVQGLMDESGFYETAILAILQTTVESGDFIKTVLSSATKNSVSLTKQAIAIYNSVDLHKYDITDPEVVSMIQNLTKNYTWRGNASTALGAVSDILSCSTDIVDYFNRISSYMALVDLQD